MPRPHTLAIFETFLAIFLWAVSFVFIKVVLREISPVTVVTVRFAIGALILGCPYSPATCLAWRCWVE